MTIAVTGATGALGSLVIDSLLASQSPSDVVAIVRDRAKASDLTERGVQVRVATYDDPAALREALDGVDTALLVSGSEVGQRVPQHVNVIDAAKAAGVGRLVYTSAPKADTTSLVLAPEHKATEEALVASGLTYTILRNNWYHENYLTQVPVVEQTGVLLAAAGDGLVASASRRDFAEAAAIVLTTDGHENAVLELTGDTAWHHDTLAAVLSKAVGRDVVYKPVSASELIETLTANGLDEGTAGFLATLDSDIANGDLAEVDPTLAELLGRPTTPLAESLTAR